MCYAYTLPHTVQLIGLCGVHWWGSSSYILAMLMLLSQTMDLEELIIQSNQNVHVYVYFCGFIWWMIWW